MHFIEIIIIPWACTITGDKFHLQDKVLFIIKETITIAMLNNYFTRENYKLLMMKFHIQIEE